MKDWKCSFVRKVCLHKDTISAILYNQAEHRRQSIQITNADVQKP